MDSIDNYFGRRIKWLTLKNIQNYECWAKRQIVKEYMCANAK